METVTVYDPVQLSSPNETRRQMVQEYLHDIGEDSRFTSVWGSIQFFNPLKAEHAPRTGYTKEQRLWVKQKRDQGLDLAPYPHLTDRERQLHHIWAQAFCQAYLGLSDYPDLINHPHNGITLSKMSHVGPYIPGVNESRHPDVHSALRNLRDNADAMRSVFNDHWNLAKEGVKYWVSGNDKQMFKIATQRTERMRELYRQKGAKQK